MTRVRDDSGNVSINKFNQRNERESCLVILSSLDSRYFGILGLIIDTITLNYVFCAS